MGDMLTQEEINALLAGGDDSGSSDTGDADLDAGLLEEMMEEAAAAELDTAEGSEAGSAGADISSDEGLTIEQQDVLGEIGNISMGTAATTLFTLLNHKVLITTPRVTVKSWKSLSDSYDRPCVGIKVNYTEGLTGSNILILKEHDVKVIADLMMGGEGNVTEPVELTELELSAIGEAMNQMVGSASTSLSTIIHRKVDIDPPQAMILNFGEDDFFERTGFIESDILACVAFRMEVGDLIDSEVTQIIPVDFARDMVDKMMGDLVNDAAAEEVAAPTQATTAPQPAVPAQADPGTGVPPQAVPPQAAPPSMGMPGVPPQGPVMGYPQQDYRQPVMYPQQGQPINAQPAQFQALDITELAQQKENIGIIMDVPLEVTVELGRTTRKIREILEFVPGTIVDLDKLAGEPIDILVNGKFVATGEVVVVDENFAVRVIDIVNVDKRI